MTTLAFGPFRLDTRTLELSCDGRPVPIRPQPCRLLALLASRPGELLTRAELAAALWPGVHVRFDLGLNSCLKQIRAALGDDADHPVWIETLARRGYRFIGAVRTSGARQPSGAKRLLVLPARDAGGPSETTASLVTAINDEIEAGLTHIGPALTVVPRASIAPALLETPSLRALAGEGIDLVLDCRIHRAAGHVRIAIQLLDAAGRSLAWAEMIEGALDDRFTIQRAAARAIAEGVRQTLGFRAAPQRMAG